MLKETMKPKSRRDHNGGFITFNIITANISTLQKKDQLFISCYYSFYFIKINFRYYKWGNTYDTT
jgi:hypothetical protein